MTMSLIGSAPYVAYVPENINFIPLIKAVRKKYPNSIKELTVYNNLLFILAQISNSLYNCEERGDCNEEGWTPIYSKIWERMVGRYKIYVDVLIEYDIIKENKARGYSTDSGRSKEYRFGDDYRNKRLQPLLIFDNKFKEKLTKSTPDAKTVKKYNHIYEWIKKLELDKEDVNKALESIYQKNLIKFNNEKNKEKINTRRKKTA